jgi:hypothetical protein
MTNLHHAVEIVAYLAIESQEITVEGLVRLLGTEGDESWDLGSSYILGERERVHGFSRLAFKECASGDDEHDSVLARLLSKAMRFEDRFIRLPDGIRVVLSVYRTGDDSVFGIGLSRLQVNFLARIGAEIDFNCVVSNHHRG